MNWIYIFTILLFILITCSVGPYYIGKRVGKKAILIKIQLRIKEIKLKMQENIEKQENLKKRIKELES